MKAGRNDNAKGLLWGDRKKYGASRVSKRKAGSQGQHLIWLFKRERIKGNVNKM